MPPRPASRAWFWAAVLLTAAKLWLTAGQRIFAIGPAFHDDRLFVELGMHLYEGNWLGPYTQFTLAKGPMMPLFIATAFALGLPLILAQQLLHAAASATLTRCLGPWVRPGAAQFALYAALLWNPMTFEAGNLSRVMRQNVYTPLALLCVAGLAVLFARRREAPARQAVPAALAGLAFGGFWLTREESIWFVPAAGLLLAAPALALRREFAARWRALATGPAAFLAAALLPILVICVLNHRHYGWFGTVEFRAREFNAAYGALTRPLVGPELPQVPVTRQMREAAYALSPAFAQLRPHLEGAVGDHWIERDLFPASERQIRGGWFVWAIRDATRAAGLAPDAGAAMRYYRTIADEMNAACDAGKIPARPRRSGFLPPFGPELTRPLLDEAITYASFFVLFDRFTAHSPESIGDYADLKPFRNIVGTRLSPAPRSPELPTPEQDRRNVWKVDVLERIGRLTATLFGWLGVAILGLGAVRGLASLIDRRISFPLGLAAALLLACVAYLAINVLVQVTSFYNMSPAALAPAYSLLIVAYAGIIADAVQAWRRSPTPAAAPATPKTETPLRLAWLAPIGAALVVFAARLAEIHFFASDVPFNDQWVVEAEQILLPWVNGTLGFTDFFRPHFEHLPVWTRLLAWLQVAIAGRWDPLMQMTVNAALYATFVALVARWIVSVLRPLPAAAMVLLLGLGGALPHAWENTAWGFQSMFPLLLICLWLFVHGSCVHAPGGRRWWLAQAAGAAGLFTLASFWLAPLALAVSWLWTGPRRRPHLLAPALLAAAGAALLALVHFGGNASFTQGPREALKVLRSALHLLGWPSVLPGAVAFVQLPWLLHAFRLRRQEQAAPADRLVFVLGLFNFLQAAALAFGRVGDSQDFVSRYGDLLFLGVLAGALALVRLTPARGSARPLMLALAVIWIALAGSGLVRNSAYGHAHFFHLYAVETATVRRQAVQDYLARSDRTVLETPAVRGVLFHDATVVARLLDEPKFRALLPASVVPANGASAAGRFVRALQTRWGLFAIAGGVLALAALAWQGWQRRRTDPLAALPASADPWGWRVAAAIGAAAIVQSLVWSGSFSLDASRRWQRWLGGDQALTGLTFRFATPAPFGPERLQGAAPLQPEILRNHFHGTAPEGPGWTGTVLSSPFTLTKPWLVVPFAGYPVAHGNGLRVRLVNERGEQVGEEIGCHGPNTPNVAFWAVETKDHIGKQAVLVLYDGRADTDAWVAASPPIPTDDPALAHTLGRGLENESQSGLRIAVGIIALVASLCAVLGWRGSRRNAASTSNVQL